MGKILVVDDEEDIVDIHSELLSTKLLCAVDKAYNGLDAFLLCQKTQYDCIITDHEMPFMKGAAFVIAVRTKENKNADTPIVFLSAFIDQQLKKSLKVSKIDFMSKPLDFDDLLDHVSRYIT
jgi:CheY-like chemotaxis protein